MRESMRSQFGFCLLAAALVSVGTASGEPKHWEPVDQAMGDLDPIAKSLRRAEVGLYQNGEQTTMFRADNDLATPSTSAVGATYYKLGSGYRAIMDRPEYLVRVGERDIDINVAPRLDGEFFQLVSANTIFDLRPMAHLELLADPFNYTPSNRIQTRIDTRIKSLPHDRLVRDGSQVPAMISSRIDPPRLDVAPIRWSIMSSDPPRHEWPEPSGPFMTTQILAPLPSQGGPSNRPVGQAGTDDDPETKPVTRRGK